MLAAPLLTARFARVLVNAGMMLVLIMAGSPLEAQHPAGTITVTVSDSSGARVSGALVQLQHVPSGDTRQTRLTNNAGTVLLPVTEAGSHRLLVKRFGYADWQSDPTDLSPISDTTLQVVVPFAPIPLAELTAEVARRCDSPPEDGPEIVRRYEMMVTSMTRVLATQDSFTFVGRLARESRVPIPERRRDRAQLYKVSDTLHIRVETPLSAPSADSLVAHGFGTGLDHVDTSTYFAPAPAVLVSEPFYMTHCFGLADGSHSDMVGLSFLPMDRDDVVDVAGTVWIEDSSTDVVRVEFSYRNTLAVLRRQIPTYSAQHEEYRGYVNARYDFLDSGSLDRFGGSIHFHRLADGRVTIREWEIRAPTVEAESTIVAANRGARVLLEPRALVTRFTLAALVPRDP